MPVAGTAMAAAAKNSYLVNKIAFFQNCTFTRWRKYTLYFINESVMKYNLRFLLLAIVIAGCNNAAKNKTTGNSFPACINGRIKEIEKADAKNPPLKIDEYNYKGKRVFLFTADCCDQFNVAYDEDCNPVCAPTGGMEGGGDHKCEDFSTAARWVTLVWEKKEP